MLRFVVLWCSLLALVLSRSEAWCCSFSGVVTTESRVRNYYDDVDQGRMESVVRLFAPNARYERGSQLVLRGTEIGDFYRPTDSVGGVRRTLKGRHTIRSLTVNGTTISVQGEFHGTQEGVQRDLTFVDVWIFNHSGQVIFRRSDIRLMDGRPAGGV